MPLSKSAILAHAGVLSSVEVHVPEWADSTGDDVVLVRGMTVREFELQQTRAEDGLATASAISRCVIDGNGARVFEDSDVQTLAELPMSAVSKLSEAIATQSGLGEKKTEADAVADAEGNSGATVDDGSSSV